MWNELKSLSESSSFNRLKFSVRVSSLIDVLSGSKAIYEQRTVRSQDEINFEICGIFGF